MVDLAYRVVEVSYHVVEDLSLDHVDPYLGVAAYLVEDAYLETNNNNIYKVYLEIEMGNNESAPIQLPSVPLDLLLAYEA